MFGFSKKSDEEEKNPESEQEQEEVPGKKKKDHKELIEENVEFYKMPRDVKLGRPQKKEKKKQEKTEKKEKETDKIQAVSGGQQGGGETDSKTKVMGAVIIISGLIIMGGAIYAGYVYFIAPSLSGPSETEPQETEEYELIINTKGQGSTSPSGGGVYEDGEVVTITVDPAEDWEFDRFSGSCSGETCEVTMTEDRQVTANFQKEEKEEYELSIDTIGQGSTDPSGGTYSEGERVTVTAEPDEGWEFDGFSGACSGTSSCRVNMNGDKELTARFEEEEEEEEETSTSSEDITDSDGDGLSDAEEEILGSDPEEEDSDDDGYEDRVEVLNLYDPLDPDQGELADNSNISEHTNSDPSYSLLYPADWSRDEMEEASTVIFQGSDISLSVVVQENSDNQSIEEWYNDEFSSQFDEEEVVEEDDWNGIRHPQEPIFYLTDKNKEYLYVLSLISPSSGSSPDSYGSLLQMMVNSFTIE